MLRPSAIDRIPDARGIGQGHRRYFAGLLHFSLVVPCQIQGLKCGQVGFEARQSRDLLDDVDDCGAFCLWQQGQHRLSQILVAQSGRPGLRHHEPDQRAVHTVLVANDYRSIGNAVAPAQSCFDLARIHTQPANS